QNETTPSSEASTEKESTPSSEASTQSQPSKETSSTENSSKQTQTSVNKNQPTSNTGKQNGGAAPSTNSGNTQSVTSSNATGSNTSESGTKSYSNYEMCAISIIPLEKVKVSISVDELDILSVEKGQTATVTLDAIEDQEFEGSITNVSSISSSTSGNAKYTVDIELPMTSEMLLGMTASATIHINEATNVPVIPMLALQQERDSTYVYTESDENGNLSGKVEVKTGLSDGSNVEITEGLEEGTTIYYTRSGNTTENNGSFNRMGGEGKMPRMQENGFAPGNSNGGQRPY
ncbi:MAG: HlyD family efflux transporter periplasmic adaptor subunit, partial [Eubacteriales bacterium]|nr:HlyD family efflux transporter periplasmic adaptor subunit [Eubacteriales bacterium]